MIFKVPKVPIENRLRVVFSSPWTAQEVSKSFEMESKSELGGVSDEASFGKGF